jgi:Ca2+-binding EF-hand superfamily protein
MSENIEAIFESNDTSFAKEFQDKVRTIHEYFDKDKDGYLNFEELSNLQRYTSGSEMEKSVYHHLCQIFGSTPNRGLSIDHLRLTYSSDGANIDEDFEKVFGKGSTESSKASIDDDEIIVVGEGGVDISPNH